MRSSWFVLVMVTAACGSSSSLDPTDIQNFRSDALAVSSAASTYGTQTAQMPSVASCMRLHQAYDSQVRPLIGRMQSVSPAMDSMMGEEHHTSDGDMGCAANAMMAELDSHQTAACASSSEMGPNETEAQRHARAMVQWATHEASRSEELGALMGMSMGMGGGGVSTDQCHRGSDGGYTFQP